MGQAAHAVIHWVGSVKEDVSLPDVGRDKYLSGMWCGCRQGWDNRRFFASQANRRQSQRVWGAYQVVCDKCQQTILRTCHNRLTAFLVSPQNESAYNFIPADAVQTGTCLKGQTFVHPDADTSPQRQKQHYHYHHQHQDQNHALMYTCVFAALIPDVETIFFHVCYRCSPSLTDVLLSGKTDTTSWFPDFKEKSLSFQIPAVYSCFGFPCYPHHHRQNVAVVFLFLAKEYFCLFPSSKSTSAHHQDERNMTQIWGFPWCQRRETETHI